MKVLHINTYNTGGAARACLRIHQALLEQGIASKVLLRNKTLSDTPEVYEIWDELGAMEKGKQYLAQKRLEKKQKRILEEAGQTEELFSFPESVWDITTNSLYEWADVIHLHWVSGFMDYGSFFEKNDKPVVWTVHDEEPFSGGYHYSPISMNSSYSELSSQHLVLKEAVIGKGQINVVSPSSFIAERSKETTLFSEQSHTVIRNCINPEVFHWKEMEEVRNQLDLPGDAAILLFVSDNFDYPRKGYSILREAVDPILNEQLILCTVGHFSKSQKEEFVIHFGRIDDESQMSQIYSSANVVIVPSLMDNLPNTIAESLCCGTPVVAHEVGGIPEMISEDLGCLCEPNSQTLRKSILMALDKKWNREMISQVNHEKYAPKACAELYVSEYKRVLA